MYFTLKTNPDIFSILTMKRKRTNFPSKVCLMRSYADLEEKLLQYAVPPLCSMITLSNLRERLFG